MDEDLDSMTREQLIDEVKKLRQASAPSRQQRARTLLASSGPVGVVAGEDRSYPRGARMAGVHAGLRAISAVAGGAGPQRAPDEGAL